MILEVGRNHLCLCGSGKKYKKCCINNQVDDFKDIILMDENIPVEAFMDGRENITTEDDNRAIYYGHYFIDKPEPFNEEMRTELLKDLLACKAKYPRNASIVSVLYYFHTVQNQPEQAQPYFEELKTQFPTYIHGRVMCAQDALNRRNVDEALSYFNGSQTLKEFDPRRSVFSIGEAAVFHAMLIQCYVRKDEERAIIRHYNNLTKVVSMSSSKNHDLYVREARELIEQWKRIRVTAYMEALMEYEKKARQGDISPAALEQPVESQQNA